MSRILIVGNLLKDVYLKLEEKQDDFEVDEEGISWLNLGFNGSAHAFYRRTSVYGGAAVTLSVLGRLGTDARIMGSRAELKDGEIVWSDTPDAYRYIFCHEGEITYFVPHTRKTTEWIMPNGTPEWILVDRSAVISPKLVEEIKNFLKFSPSTKLAVHAEKRMSPTGKTLSEMADMLFLEDEPPMHKQDEVVDKLTIEKPSTQIVCHISPRKIVMGEAEETWRLSKTDMLTHLTVYSTIVATILGVISAGGTMAEAVLWARLNAEQATLESSLSAAKLQELAKVELEKRENLQMVAKSLVSARRGVLAADESNQTLTERLVHFGIPATEKMRKKYRELLLTMPDLKQYVNGVILTEELANTKAIRGQTYIEYLIGQGIIPGIKADGGQAKLANTDETYTIGIEDLPKRLRRYYNMGARFAKWHARYTIDLNQPSFIAVEKSTCLLADFAKECQLVGLVPVVESDVCFEGDYTIEQNIEVTNRVLTALFDKLDRRRVDLSSIVVKTNMVVAGKNAVIQNTPADVGEATAAILKHAIPKYIAGVLVLSGGQEANTATKNLANIVRNGPLPWPLTFAFSRALQDPVMQTWHGDPNNIPAAQAALKRHLQDNIAALTP